MTQRYGKIIVDTYRNFWKALFLGLDACNRLFFTWHASQWHTFLSFSFDSETQEKIIMICRIEKSQKG